MRKLLLVCLVFILLAASVSAAPSLQQDAATGTAAITSFATTANSVARDDLANRTARVPVSWTTENRPLTANLVFEQILPGGGVVNVELPRLLPWVVSNGQGLAAPIFPGGDAAEIVLRARMINLFNGSVLDEQELRLPIVSGGTSGSVGDRASITSFTTTTTFVNEDHLANGSARVPVSWATANRPATTSLVFEQVFGDGSTESIELPRDNPFVPSSGNGMTAPVSPGSGETSIRLRVSLFDLLNGRVYDLREIALPVLPAGATPTATTAPAADIRTFTLDATELNANALADGTARVVVHWSVANRPADSNLVFEQVLANGTVVNVELPRSNPIVASEGQGLIAPRAPGNGATTARFVLSLVALNSSTVYDRVEVTLPVVTPPTATPSPTVTAQSYNLTLSTNITGIMRQEISAGGRIQVSWSVSPRPADTNLYFEQVFPDGSAYNVELPRPNPYVPSAGMGAVAPLLPPENVNQIVIRVRLATLSAPTTLAQRELIVPLTGEGSVTPSPRRFNVFTPSNLVIEHSQINGGSVIIPVSWEVTQRPIFSNLVFEQVFPNGSFVNAELPRPDPIVPSAGTGAVQLRDPGADVAQVRVRVRLIDLNSSRVYDQRELTIPIAGRGASAVIPPEATSEATAEAQSADTTTCPNAWFVDSLPGCPSNAAERIEVIVQQFENGLMIYRGVTNQVYFLTIGNTVIVGQPGAFDGLTEPPSGFFAPSPTFAGLWGANQELAGWATTPEGSYLAMIQSSADALALTLPDGRVALLTPASSPGAWQAVG